MGFVRACQIGINLQNIIVFIFTLEKNYRYQLKSLAFAQSSNKSSNNRSSCVEKMLV